MYSNVVGVERSVIMAAHGTVMSGTSCVCCRMKLAEYREFMDIQEEEERQAKAAVALEKQLRKTHYLVSTDHIPGVYNSPFRK